MRYLALVAALALAVILAGCGSKDADIQGVAQKTTIPYTGTLTPNADAERVLEKAFRESDVPWDEEMTAEIDLTRSAIKAQGQYLKERVDFESTLPYYTYKAGFELFVYLYNRLQKQLDTREAMGALSDEGKVIYSFVRRDINYRLELQRAQISATEKGINETAGENSIAELENLYATIKPLLGMVL